MSVVGLGYVGLSIALAAQRVGHAVTGIDTNTFLVQNLAEGEFSSSDISEVSIKESLSQGLRVTTEYSSIREATTIVICVPTPLNEDGKPDLKYIEIAGKVVGDHLIKGQLVILESTSHPGTTSDFLLNLLETRSGLEGGKDFYLAFSSERIDPNNSRFNLINTPKVVGGHSNECGEKAKEFYSSFVHQVVRAKGTREAELSKLIENSYRLINIAFVNSLLEYSRMSGIDLWDAIECARTKPFGFEAFFPGPGVGGHCIPVDPVFLSEHIKSVTTTASTLLEDAKKINDQMPAYVARRALEELLKSGKKNNPRIRILLLGVSYKKNISDTRETPAKEIARILADKGYQVSYYDPHVKNWSPSDVCVEEEISLIAAIDRCDLAILLQDHDAFDHTVLNTSACLILDTRNVLTGRTISKI